MLSWRQEGAQETVRKRERNRLRTHSRRTKEGKEGKEEEEERKNDLKLLCNLH